MTNITDAQWEALAEAFAGGSAPAPADSFTIADIVAASHKAGRPIETTTARLRVRDALRHGLITCVVEPVGTRAARYVYADGVTAADVAARLRREG